MRSAVLNRRVLADDFVTQAVLSHELAHFVLKHDADGRCRDRQRSAISRPAWRAWRCS